MNDLKLKVRVRDTLDICPIVQYRGGDLRPSEPHSAAFYGLLWPVEENAKLYKEYKCNYVTNACKITPKTIQNYRLRPSWGIEIVNEIISKLMDPIY